VAFRIGLLSVTRSHPDGSSQVTPIGNAAGGVLESIAGAGLGLGVASAGAVAVVLGAGSGFLLQPNSTTPAHASTIIANFMEPRTLRAF
jgi:hypothetical protein